MPGEHGARVTTAALTVAVAAAVVVGTCVFPRAAQASQSHATASGTEQLTAASWGASSSPGSFSWDLIGGSQTSTVANTGTVALTQISYTITVSSGIGLTTFTLAVCGVAWSGNLCSGGAGTAIGGTFSIGSVSHVTSAVVPAVSGDVYLKATASGITLTSITMTLSLAVTGSSTPATSQLRAAVTTNQ